MNSCHNSIVSIESTCSEPHPSAIGSASASRFEDNVVATVSEASTRDLAERCIPVESASIEMQLFKCHRALMSVRESVDAKRSELQAEYEQVKKELESAMRSIAKRDVRIQKLTDERDELRDEVSRLVCEDSTTVKSMSHENAKMIRRMREMQSENVALKRENELLKQRLQEAGVAVDTFSAGQTKRHIQDDKEPHNQNEAQGQTFSSVSLQSRRTAMDVRPRMERRLSGEKRPRWFLDLAQEDEANKTVSSHIPAKKQTRDAKASSLRSLKNAADDKFAKNDDLGEEDEESGSESESEGGSGSGSGSESESDAVDEKSLRSNFASQASLSTKGTGALESRASKIWEAVEGSLLDEASSYSGRASVGQVKQTDSVGGSWRKKYNISKRHDRRNFCCK